MNRKVAKLYVLAAAAWLAWGAFPAAAAGLLAFTALVLAGNIHAAPGHEWAAAAFPVLACLAAFGGWVFYPLLVRGRLEDASWERRRKTLGK